MRVGSPTQGRPPPGPRAPGLPNASRWASPASAHPQPPVLPALGPFSRQVLVSFPPPRQLRSPPPLPWQCCELSRGSSCPERRLLGNTAYLTRVATVTAPRAQSLAVPWQPLSVRPRRFQHFLAWSPAAG